MCRISASHRRSFFCVMTSTRGLRAFGASGFADSEAETDFAVVFATAALSTADGSGLPSHVVTACSAFALRFLLSCHSLYLAWSFGEPAGSGGGGTGGRFSDYLFPYRIFGITVRPALTVRNAWAQMAFDKEPNGTIFRSMGNIAAGNVPAGVYDLVAYARSSATGTFNNWRVARVTVQ